MDNKLLSRRVAVTGSTGMIGSHLVAQMVRTGYTDILLPVRNLKRIDNLRRTFDRMEIAWPVEGVLTIVETDITETAALTEILKGTDTVFNCAGIIMTGDLTEQQIIDNNVSVARAVAQASIKVGVRYIIHTSSIVVLAPNQNTDQPITEECKAHESAHKSAYARSKELSDCEIRKIEDEGLGLTILYPAVVLGEGDWSMNGSSALIPLMASGVPFYTDGVMAYVDIRDIARSYIVVDGCVDAVGQNFIISEANLTYRNLINLGAEAAGKRKPFIKVGTPLALMFYGFIKFATALHLMKDRSITRSNLDSVLYGNRYSGEKLTKICGFKYTPIKDSVNRIVKAYLSEK